MSSNGSLPAGLAPIENLPPIGLMPNKAHQGSDAVFAGSNFSLAIVEFDDQGRCQDRDQMHALEAKLTELQDRDAIVIVFVHGWKHDGRSDDDNLAHFCSVLQRVATQASSEHVPVIGVFVAWRGLSLYGYGVLENVTFWDRKQAGLRVAMGAPRELFGRLRQYRRKRLKDHGAPLLLIIGHSFGGLIVYAALAQSLIEAAATKSGHIVPSFADLVLLVNPAFEADRYLPVHDLVEEHKEGDFAENQLPVFVSVTAKNDWATHYAFPAGMAIALVQESAKGCEEKQALINTMGHLAWMRTHELAKRSLQIQTPTDAVYGSTVLKKIRFDKYNPFWVVSATKEVVNGHDGIWLQPFADFVEALVMGHARDAEARRAVP
jgi:pimeloyl-ACP methyl ester carboxylesterase